MSNASSSGLRLRRSWLLLRPSLADLFFPVLLLAVFGRASAWRALLADGDTGWHIRTGDFILATGTVPLHDLFSFSRLDQPWFAWEWLGDIVFALLHRWKGLEAVAAFSAVLLSLSAVLLLRWILRRGAGLWVGLPVALAAVSASSIHYLARPHIFSLLFVILTLWILDEDCRSPGRLVWVLVPMSALWCNLHGGFVCGLAILALRAAIGGLQEGRAPLRRYGTLALLSSAATLLNPYGWNLHRHIVEYLGSSWILDNVQEFQSPHIRGENTQVFAVMLLFGVALVSRAFARKQWFEGVLVLALGFAALRSARHVPLYAVASAPLMAQECEACWAAVAGKLSRRSATRILWELSHEFGRSRRIGVWTLVLGALAFFLALPRAGMPDFPESSFPVAAVTRNSSRFVPSTLRVLTSDQWADYLIYRFYPRQRVFFDGRSDFYGPALGSDYQKLLSVAPGWRQALERYRFEVALLPLDWALGAVLENDPDWLLVDRDAVSVLLVRRGAALKETRGTAEYKCVSQREDDSRIALGNVPRGSLSRR